MSEECGCTAEERAEWERRLGRDNMVVHAELSASDDPALSPDAARWTPEDDG